MVENKKEHKFMDIITEGLSYVSKIISASVLPPIIEGSEMVIKNVEDRLIRIVNEQIIGAVEKKMMLMEKRLFKKISSLLIIGFGAAFLIFALFFFLKEFLFWSNTAAFFSIGIIIFVIGLILKIKDSNIDSNKYE